jgi:sulfite exporter TauE/SafE
MDHALHAAPVLAAGLDPTALKLAAMLFAVALFGGFTHCGAMCGPFVLGQVAGQRHDGPVLRRLVGSLLLPFHLGRLATYAALGALAGAVGSTVASATGFRFLASVLLGIAALLFLLQGLRLAAPRWFASPRRIVGASVGNAIARTARHLLRDVTHGGGFALGLTIGFLPCAFLYGALAASAAAGSAAGGGLAMAGFALGTIPSLATVGLAGAALARRWSLAAGVLVGPVYLFNALVLATMALKAAS